MTDTMHAAIAIANLGRRLKMAELHVCHRLQRVEKVRLQPRSLGVEATVPATYRLQRRIPLQHLVAVDTRGNLASQVEAPSVTLPHDSRVMPYSSPTESATCVVSAHFLLLTRDDPTVPARASIVSVPPARGISS